jgi:hypothetical protein
MTLRFPNSSRAYDATHRAFRFWGHDEAMEASFFIDEQALMHIQPGLLVNEAEFLGVFDLHRERIHAAAVKVYGRGRRGSYDLVTSDV